MSPTYFNCPRTALSHILMFAFSPALSRIPCKYHIGFNTTCKDYDSINQQARPSTTTTGPQRGEGGQTMTMPGGGG